MIDFNSGKPQGWFSPRQIENPRYAAELKSRLEGQAESVLAYLWPNGRLNKKEFEVGSIGGEAGQSLKISLRPGKIGVGCDFAGGEVTGDLIDCWAFARRGRKARGRDFAEVCEEIEQWLGLPFKPRAQPSAKTESPEDLGPPSAVYNYLDADGKVLVVIKRFDPSNGKKTFRQWDATRNAHNMPAKDRPLYNLPKVARETVVVFVEGEKAADALTGLGVPATTAMGGSKADPSLTDWSPLAGKTVIIWPDADKPGAEYAEAVASSIAAAGGRIQNLAIPPEKSDGWDAADAVAEGFDVIGLLNQGFDRQAAKSAGIEILAWGAERFDGDPKEVEWLVDGSIPLATAGLLVAMGDAGKGILTLDLALKVATPKPDPGLTEERPSCMGGSVMSTGAVVVISAEDDQDELHRRIHRLDPDGRRFDPASRLYLVPLPNAGGPQPMVKASSGGLEATQVFFNLRQQLLGIDGLKLVILDPLASFVHADINADPAAGAFVTGLLATLATETGATVLVCHHMTKGHSKVPITTPEQARDAIRGTSAIVDGVRFAYALWPAEEADGRRACRALGTDWTRNRVFRGAVVKSNAKAERSVKTFVRDMTNGLLVDTTDKLARNRAYNRELEIDTAVAAIAEAAEAGRPFTRHGKNGLYERRSELHPPLQTMSRDMLVGLVDHLLTIGRIVQALASGTSVQWLDLPDGPFARGIGEFSRGAAKPNGIVPEQMQ